MGKGGGYANHWRTAVGAPGRHHHWTGTNDSPRSLIPPKDGGLDKPPGRWERFKHWLRYWTRWGRPE